MSDSLKQAVEGLEVAWRRLREVLDGPDVAAALVERQAVRPMSTAPRDGTWIVVRVKGGGEVSARWRKSVEKWRDKTDLFWSEEEFIGWSPVK